MRLICGCYSMYKPCHNKILSLGIQKRLYTNRAIQPWKMTGGLKFQIKEVLGLYCVGSKNKGADLHLYFCSFNVCMGKKQLFSGLH